MNTTHRHRRSRASSTSAGLLALVVVAGTPSVTRAETLRIPTPPTPVVVRYAATATDCLVDCNEERTAAGQSLANDRRDTGFDPDPPPAGTGIVMTYDFFGIQPQSPAIFGRDGAYSARVGDDVLWVYGDTFSSAGLFSSTAAIGRVDDPLAFEDSLSADAGPQQFIPYTPDEVQFNAAGGVDNRIALWPLGAIATGRHTAVVPFIKLIVRGTLDYTILGTGVAAVHIRSPKSRIRLRVVRDRDLLFGPDEPLYRPVFTKRVANRNYVYFYSPDSKVARVPLRRLHVRRDYQFWDGSRYMSDASAARAVAQANLNTISFDAHLGRYLSTSSRFWSNLLELRTAPAPEGPWSDPTIVNMDVPPNAEFFNWHPAYGDDRNIVLSYVTFTSSYVSQIRLFRVTLDGGAPSR